VLTASPIELQGRGPVRLTIPADLSRLEEVRARVGEIGQAAGPPDSRVFDVQVVTSEAIANAMELAKPAGRQQKGRSIRPANDGPEAPQDWRGMLDRTAFRSTLNSVAWPRTPGGGSRWDRHFFLSLPLALFG
jgi:hypothetical protein